MSDRKYRVAANRFGRWFTDPEMRLAFVGGGEPEFRWPWSRVMSLAEARENEFFAEMVADQEPKSKSQWRPMTEITDAAMVEMREAYGCSDYELWFEGRDGEIAKISLTVDQAIEAVLQGVDVRPCGGVGLANVTLQAFEKS